MKKTNSLFWSMLFACASVFVGCSDDDNNSTPSTPSNNNIAGEYTQDLILDAAVAYTLDGALVMKEGTKLTIPAGTVITAKGATASYIAISKGAQIDVNGTATNPVVMTADIEGYGQWGGLVICGDAPVNTDESLSEVGSLPYGGNNASDDSGEIEYLRVEYTGYQFTSEKQFNGVSFFGVGSGTEVSYVSSYKGNDDGIEFFGGAVNADHLVSIESQDDGIDFADGWSGTGSFWYAKDSRKSGIEGSNNGNDPATTPMTTATISNATIIGMGEKPWFLKEGAGVQTIDNVVIGGLTNDQKGPYFYADDDITPANITITNARFTDSVVGKFDTGITGTENVNATGAGNGADAPTWAAGWATPAN